jgi:23S rRNA (pseudouridine1915-N3)-methyltransferase
VRVQLIAVGTKMPAWVLAGYQEYAKRLPKLWLPKLVEIELGHRGKSSSLDAARRAEADAILALVPAQHQLVALEVLGKPWSTPDVANHLAQWQMGGSDVSFVIGGPDGLDPKILERANSLWSLSNLTLPHPLVRIVFIEQLYRAWTLLQNHPYHK